MRQNLINIPAWDNARPYIGTWKREGRKMGRWANVEHGVRKRGVENFEEEFGDNNRSKLSLWRSVIHFRITSIKYAFEECSKLWLEGWRKWGIFCWKKHNFFTPPSAWWSHFSIKHRALHTQVHRIDCVTQESLVPCGSASWKRCYRAETQGKGEMMIDSKHPFHPQITQ